MSEITVYDKKDVFEKDILPLMRMIQLICDRENIPAFMLFAPVNSEKETPYVKAFHSPRSFGIVLADDHFAGHAKVEAGFELIPRTLSGKLLQTEPE